MVGEMERVCGYGLKGDEINLPEDQTNYSLHLRPFRLLSLVRITDSSRNNQSRLSTQERKVSHYLRAYRWFIRL
jgi:hypothetical protein